MKNFFRNTIIILVIIFILGYLASIAKAKPIPEPTLEEISICFHTKSHLFAEAMKNCTEEDYECMMDNFIKVCEFK